MATISTHNGSAVRRQHNIRNKKVTSKQLHIDPGGEHEIWKDETIAHAYHRIFDKYVEEYNSRQKRSDRMIKNYLADIRKDAKKHECYEMIIGVYKGGDIQTNKRIMKEFVNGWEKRNPNLEMIGAYYHADEEGEPHVHIDYIPVAHGYKKGMETQTGLVKALNEMGFYTHGSNNTAQMQWEKAENKALEEICNYYGVVIEHPQTEAEHLHTEIYKAKKDTEKAITEKEQAENEVAELKRKCDTLESDVNEKKTNLENIDNIIVFKTDELNTLEQNINELEADILTARTEINALQVDVEEKKDAKRLIDMIEAVNKEIKNRQPYKIEIIEEHEARHNPITKKETRPATVEISKEDYDTFIRDKNMIQILRDLIDRIMDLFKMIMDKLKSDAVEKDEYRSLNSLYHSTREELIQAEDQIEALMDDKTALEDELERKNDTLEYLRSKIPEIAKWERLRAYEYNYKNREIYGCIEKDTLYIKDPDGRKLEIWTFMKAYAKECLESDMEIDEEMSLIYAGHHYGITLKEAVSPKRINHNTIREREYSL